MSRIGTVLSAFCAIALVFAASENVWAQDADTLDVPQGFETLNVAIEGDTSETGAPKNLNRVYRLERGGFYLLNGAVRGVGDAPLRIVAAEGDGPRPILIPAVDESGGADRAFRPRGNITVRGLYVTGIDNLGNQATKNMFRADGDSARIVIDDCFLDYDAQSFIRMNSDEQKLYITNTIARNAFLLADPNNGRYIDTRSNTQDTIFVQNCTFYVNTGDVIRAQGGIIKNIVWDHVTTYQAKDEMDLDAAINARVTNSLFIDWGFEGDIRSVDPADSLAKEAIPIDTLGAGGLVPDDQRNIRITNNVMGWTPEVLAWINSIDTLEVYVLHNRVTQAFIDMFPNMVSENNINEYPEFSDAPSSEAVLAFAQHRLNTGFSNEGNPDPAADRNGKGPLDVNPGSVGPAEDEYDFDYSTSSQAYTHAEGGFPVGDLNWFPDKKAEWEEFVSGVKDNRTPALPSRFTLEQNYPNPFNPSTTIAYHLSKSSTVELTVYNLAGQKIRTLVSDKRQNAGNYSVQWDGRNDAGRAVVSGLYVYRLKSDSRVQSRKMLLLK